MQEFESTRLVKNAGWSGRPLEEESQTNRKRFLAANLPLASAE
jgi:hypothetical protein